MAYRSDRPPHKTKFDSLESALLAIMKVDDLITYQKPNKPVTIQTLLNKGYNGRFTYDEDYGLVENGAQAAFIGLNGTGNGETIGILVESSEGVMFQHLADFAEYSNIYRQLNRVLVQTRVVPSY